jgi:hypothetical protein
MELLGPLGLPISPPNLDEQAAALMPLLRALTGQPGNLASLIRGLLKVASAGEPNPVVAYDYRTATLYFCTRPELCDLVAQAGHYDLGLLAALYQQHPPGDWFWVTIGPHGIAWAHLR